MAILNKQSHWQEPLVWHMPPLKTPPPPPPPPRVVCWDDEVRTDPRAWLISSCLHACVFVAQLYGFLRGLNLWNSCASCPEWELRMSHCHLANSPASLPPRLLSLHQLWSQGIRAPGGVKLNISFLPTSRTLPFTPRWSWALRNSPTRVCCFNLQRWTSGRITGAVAF